MYVFILEIDRHIGLPIFKHFTIIGFEKKKSGFEFFFFCRHIHYYTEYNQQWNFVLCIWPIQVCTHTHTWSSGHTHTHLEQWAHTHTWSSGHTHTHRHLEQWTHTHMEQWTHTHGAVDTHTRSSGHTHTHLEQWTHTHTPGAVDTHTHTPGAVDTHTHLEQWTLFTLEKLQHNHRM